MRKLSITLLAIAISFMAMAANSPTGEKRRVIDIKRWDKRQKSIVLIPIIATVEDNYIEVRFLEQQDIPVTIQIKNEYGNIVFIDMIIPSNLEIYKINLDNFDTGHYELIYSQEGIDFTGVFILE